FLPLFLARDIFPENRLHRLHREKQIGSAMAPCGEKSQEAISSVVIIIAMQTEAMPLVNKFELKEDQDSVFPEGVPWVRYHGTYKDLHLNIIWPGKDTSLVPMDTNGTDIDVVGHTCTQQEYEIHDLFFANLNLILSEVDSVGTISASLVTYASIQALKPDLIINAGTAGGFKAKGASIGDVFLISDVAFHDRRIPIPVFDLYGVGQRQAFSTPNLLRELNLKVCKLSTGDSLDMSSQDETSITANDATIKDMEDQESEEKRRREKGDEAHPLSIYLGAAVAYVADLFKVPAIFVKAVTDLVDGDKPTAEEFMQNLVAVTAALEQSVSQVIDFINGKRFSEL
ncbi:hypothetical protein CUMW_240370, partial [Citrus unshiu]